MQRARYPSISLAEAVEKATRVYEIEGRNAMTSAVAAQHMGYKGLNGASLGVLAALKKYGLLEGRADEIRVTQTTVVIVSDRKAEDQSERVEAIRQALVSEPLFRELSERYGSKTTILNVASYLQKKGFSPDAAKNAAKSYMESVAFVDQEAKGYNPIGPLVDAEFAVPSGTSVTSTTQAATSLAAARFAVDTRETPIPIAGVSNWPILRLPASFTAKNWDDMMTVLNAIKPGLITPDTGTET